MRGLNKLIGIILGVLLLTTSVFAFDSWNNYPDDFFTTCNTEWKEGYFYYHEVHPYWELVPDEIPEEGFEVPADEFYCQDPNGYWLAEYDDMQQETFVPWDKYAI